MPASLNGERSRAFCFPHLLTFQKAVQCAALTMTGSIGFDIGSDFSHCPPSETMRDYLNPPLIRGCLDCESELIFRVSPGTGSSSFSECVERSPLQPSARMRAAPIDRIWAFFSILGRPHF